MKTTKWQRTVSLLLCLLMAMSFLTVAAPKAYAADDVTAAASEVTWPQITSFTVTDGYLYDKSNASSRTAACEVETTEAEIVNYTELRKSANDYLGLAGEIRIKVKSPVSVADGSPTTTPAKAPGFLRLLSGGYSMTASKDATVVTDRNLTTAPSATDPNTYRSSNNDAVRVAIQDTGKKWYYYDLVVTIDTQSGETNTAPTIKEGMVNPTTADATVGTAWTLDLTTIFEDADNDTLTYKVKVGDAEAIAAEANYSYTPEAAGTTTLVFTANDGKADSPEYTVTLNVTAAASEVTWPQITSFTVTDGYLYDKSNASSRTAACEVETTEAEIVNYTELRKSANDYLGLAGEIRIKVKSPVSVADGSPTTTPAKAPGFLRLLSGGYSMTASKDATVVTDRNLTTAPSATDPNTYRSSNNDAVRVAIQDTGKKWYYYDLVVTIDTQSGETNTAPTIKEGMVNPTTADATVGTAWTLDLTTIFEDADNDTLTYKVKVGDAEAIAAEANYSYTPEAAGTTTLVFTANDGKADSPEYTVTLNVTAASEETYTITAAVDGAYIINTENVTQPMGTTEITVNGTSASEAKVGDLVMVKAIPQKYSYVKTDLYDAKFDRWEVVAGPTGLLSDAELKNAELTFNMPAATVSLKAVFVAVGSQVTLTANNFDAGDVALKIGDWQTVASTYDSTSGQHKYNSVTRTVIAGAKVSAYIDTAPTANAGFKLDSWEIKNVTKNEIVVPEYVASNHPADGSSYMIPYFTVDGTSDYEIKAIFKAKDYGDVNVTVNDESMGTATAQIGTEEAAASIKAVVEGTEVKLQAQPNPGYIFQSWSATYGSDNTQVAIANSTAAQTTFVMPETNHQPVNVVATFVEDPNYLSEECVLESVLLLDHSGNTFEGDQDGTAFTVTLPADADASNLANMVLKLTYSKNAKVFRDGDTAAWNANGQACNMTLGTVTKFVVRSQKDLTEGNEGPTREYTITIKKAAAPNAPTLSNGSATRTSKTGATVKFTSSEAGNYFYKVVDHGAAVPTVDEIMKSTTKGTASAGETTFTLSNLIEDARDIYIVVVGAAGGESAPLKVEIPAYGSGTDTPDTGAYKISISAPKGGTITTNRTKADAGDEIIVTVTPDNGYQMVSGSLTYTLETAGGETKTITNGRFTMPAGDVSITCKWETATTTAKGITSFSISGVVGAVNNTTNTITITLPRGTDVTKLTPVIATNGVKSLTPGNGETVDFTNAVTYTAAMEDGSSKTYTVTVYVDRGTLADQFWDKLTDFATQVPWWQYAEKQQSTSKYPKYW